MSKSSSSRRGQFWRSDRFVGACIVVGVVVACAGKKVDGRSDLYSLGVMLFQMLTGVLPFRGDSMAELMYKIANADAPELRAIRNDLPEQLTEVVARALAKKPDLRYQDGDQFAADLRAVMARLSVPGAGAGEDTGAGALSLESAAHAHAVAEKTLVLAAGAAAGPSASHPDVAAGAPVATGYDPAPKASAADDPFAKTAVFGRPAGSAHPPGGGGHSGSET